MEPRRLRTVSGNGVSHPLLATFLSTTQDYTILSFYNGNTYWQGGGRLGFRAQDRGILVQSSRGLEG